MQKSLSIIFLLILLTIKGFSQNDGFSTDHLKFFEEMKNALIMADRDKGKEISEKLELAIKKKGLPSNRIDAMIFGINEMLKKRYRPYPHFVTFIDVIFASVEGNIDDKVYAKWEKSMLYTLKKKTAGYFTDYLDNSANLFRSNGLFKSTTTFWLAKNGGWQLEFQEDSDPYVKFTNIDLTVRSKGDSSVIYGTSGTWYMYDGKFVGKNGTLYWTRAGLPKDRVFAKLNNFKIELKSPKFEADSVVFTHLDYFPDPVIGKLEEKVLSDQTVEGAIYPQFTSYDKRVKLKNLAQDVDYEGGFAFKGNKFIGAGDEENPAYLKFYKNGKLAMRSASTSYTFKENQIITERAAITIYINMLNKLDSIYHPGLVFKYLTDKRELSLLRMGDGLVKSLYKDTYHNIEMDIEAIYWKFEEPRIQIASIKGSTEGKANFYSNNFYRDFIYEKLMGVAENHPLSIMKTYLDAKKTKSFTGAEMASHFKDDRTQIRQMLMRLSILGLLRYDVDKDQAEVSDKFFNWVNARARKQDYDVIEFNSEVAGSAPNASLSLLDYNLKLFGVPKVALSDSQSVYVYPRNEELVMKENMDFNFDGRIAAGRFVIFGKKFDFFYDKFKMELENVDSVRIRVPSKTVNEKGQKPLVNVKTVIEGVKGTLEIDRPDNKSGLKGIAKYPIFTSKQPSYTYYQRGSIEGNVYKRSNFYFMLDPFVIDSLDVFDTEKLALDGVFASAGIFPEFREKLVIMDDYSLGFSRKTPSEGFEVYGGPGVYKNEINLSHRGLRGNGVLKYLASTAESNNFKWYPDSMNTVAQKFNVEKTKGKVEYPDVTASDVYIHWEPFKDKFLIKNTPGSPISIYKGESKMYGQLNLTSLGMLGNGKMDVLESATFNSKEFRLRAETFRSDTMGFGLKNIDTKDGDTSGLALDMQNVKGEVSFQNREANLKSNSDESFVRFPVNKYIAYMEELIWKMDKNEVDMNTKMITDINLKGALFISTKKDQDSLSFVSPKAKFVLSDKSIYANEVKLMDVADSRIYPADQKLIVRKDAFMEPLKGATMEMPIGVKTHTFYDADITVGGRWKVTGKGKYDFTDETGRKQTINVSKIDVDSSRNVYGKGTINETEGFRLSPKIDFKGEFLINSQNPELRFDGYARLNNECSGIQKNWMRFDARINPKNILIPVSEDPKNENKNALFNGFCFASDSSGIYPVMLSSKVNFSDYEVIKVSGFLTFDNKTSEYKISSKEKLEDINKPGPYISFKTSDCSAYGEGKLDIGGKLGQVSTITAGSISYDSKSENTQLRVMFGIKFPFENDLWTYISEKLTAAGVTTPGDLKNSEYYKNFAVIVPDQKRVTRLKEDIQANDLKRLPDELEQTLLFTNLTFNWDKNKKCLIHDGMTTLLTLNGKVYNKMINVKVQIDRKRGGDAIHIMLEPNTDNYYYFYYKNNLMTAISSNADFNKRLAELDPKKRVVEGKDGMPPYSFAVGTQRKATQFKESFNE